MPVYRHQPVQRRPSPKIALLAQPALAQILVDDSVPRFTGTPTNGNPITSSSFTPPNNSLLVVAVNADTSGVGGAGSDITVSVSGGSLTWANRVERDTGDAGGNRGHASIFTAEVATGASMTVSATRTAGDGGTNRLSAKVYIVTGYNVGDPVGALGEGSATATSNTPNAYTSTVDNSRGFGAATDWGQNGNLSSSDVEDVADYVGAIAVISLYKASNTPTSGSVVTINFVTDGAGSSEWNWVALEVKPGVGGGAVALDARAWVRTTSRSVTDVGRAVTARTSAASAARSSTNVIRAIDARSSGVGSTFGSFGAIALQAMIAGLGFARSSTNVARTLSVKSAGSGATRGSTAVGRAVASRATGSAQSRLPNTVNRALSAGPATGSSAVRSAASVARSLTVRTAGGARTAANTAVARLLAVRAASGAAVQIAFEGLGAITARVRTGARVVGSLIASRALETRAQASSRARSSAIVAYALNAITHSRGLSRASASVAVALSSVIRTGAASIGSASASRALSAVIRTGAIVRSSLPPIFVEVVGIVRFLLRASMDAVGIKASMSRQVVTGSMKAAKPISVSAINMIAKNIALKGYVIGDDTEIGFELTDWPAGVVLAKAYFTMKNSLKDLDAAAIVQREITISLTAEGRITANGSLGTATGYFLIRHQDAEWANVIAAKDYYFDISPITDQSTVQTPIVGTISFIKGRTDAIS